MEKNFPMTEDVGILMRDYAQVQLEHHGGLSRQILEESFRNFWNALSTKQRNEYATRRIISAVGNVTGFTYVINCATSYVGNVYLMNELGDPITNFCCYPMKIGEVASGWLGQKLAIENNEKYWLTKAVQHGRNVVVAGVTPDYPNRGW
jgi:hypothetical protein